MIKMMKPHSKDLESIKETPKNIFFKSEHTQLLEVS